MILLTDEEVQLAAASIDWIGVLEGGLSRLGDGAPDLPKRLTLESTKGVGWYRFMPVIAYNLGFAGYKAMNFHPVAGVRYLIVLIEIETGETVAMLDGNWVTAYRTAGAAAIATDRLARSGPLRLAVIGTGMQARALVEAVTSVRDFAAVQVFSRREEHRTSFAAEMSERVGLRVEPASDLARMVSGAEVVICGIRAGNEPVIFADDVAAGAVVCGTSSVRPDQREVDVKVWAESEVVVVDDLEHFRDSGDGRAIAADSEWSLDRAVELWNVLQDPSKGRTNDDQRVLYKSVGTAEQDIALASVLLRQAQVLGLGCDVGPFPSVRRFR